MNIRLKPLAASISLLVLNAAFAQSNTALEPVVVTATRQVQRVNDLVADVTLIERAQIERSAVATLGELLGQQAGIQFNRTGGVGQNESVYLRGSNSDHVLVLVDGVRIGSATLGTTSLEMIPLSQIERVEILKGGASSLYGADAMSGVIQIFTRANSAPGTSMSVGVGNRGTYETSLSHQGSYGDLAYNLSLGDSASQGSNQIRNPSSLYYNSDKDGNHNQNLSAGLRYKLDQGEVGYRHFLSDSTNHFDSATYDPNTYDTILANANWKTRHQVISDSVWARKQLTSFWQSSLSFSRGVDESVSSPSSEIAKPNDKFKTVNRLTTWQNDISLPLGSALVAYEHLAQGIESTNSYDAHERTINSVLLGWNADIGQHSIQTNYRKDENSQFGQRENYTVGYAYRIDSRWRVAAVGGTAFKAPTFNQLYFPATPYVGIGNPTLKPESSHNKEVRVNYSSGTFDGALAWFDNQIKNLISWGDAPAPYYLTPTNVGEARITGWEGSASAKLGLWQIGSNLTVQNPRDSEGHQLNRRSRHFGLAYLGYDTGMWKARLEIAGFGKTYDDPLNKREMGGYGLVNLYADKRLDAEWSLFARANNIFDRNYLVSRTSFDNSEYYGLGASFLVGLRYSIK